MASPFQLSHNVESFRVFREGEFGVLKSGATSMPSGELLIRGGNVVVPSGHPAVSGRFLCTRYVDYTTYESVT
jgi:hypothetical protein